MKKTTKKLALRKETVRRLASGDLMIVQGGLPTLTVTNCGEGECNPPQSATCSEGIVCGGTLTTNCH
jgi:hypothetical protein